MNKQILTVVIYQPVFQAPILAVVFHLVIFKVNEVIGQVIRSSKGFKTTKYKCSFSLKARKPLKIIFLKIYMTKCSILKNWYFISYWLTISTSMWWEFTGFTGFYFFNKLFLHLRFFFVVVHFFCFHPGRMISKRVIFQIIPLKTPGIKNQNPKYK